LGGQSERAKNTINWFGIYTYHKYRLSDFKFHVSQQAQHSPLTFSEFCVFTGNKNENGFIPYQAKIPFTPSYPAKE